MNLHRTTGQPDWADIEPAKYNRWQSLAAVSHGLVTPGNIITVAGLALVVAGLIALGRHDYLVGLVLVAVGRAFDLLDGIAAEATGTKSPLGETFDATADKIGTFLILVLMILAGLAAWPLIALIAAPHIIISVIAYRAERAGRRLHPSRLGKLSMAAAWAGLLLLIIPAALGIHNHSLAAVPGYILSLASAIMGFIAAADYYRTSR